MSTAREACAPDQLAHNNRARFAPPTQNCNLKLFGYLTQEQVKLRTSDLAGTFTGSI